MFLENDLHTKVKTRKVSIYTAMQSNRCKLISYTPLKKVPTDVKNVAKTILDYYCSSASDFLKYISLGNTKHIQNLKYRLNPPYTTAKSDVDTVCQLLHSIGTITDYCYSTVSNTYIVTLSTKHSTTIKMLYSIAVAQLVCSIHHLDLNDVLLDVKLSDRNIDVLWLHDSTIHSVYVEPTVTNLKYLRDKIFLNPLVLPYTNVSETLLVDLDTLSLLPPSNKILPITGAYNLE